MAEPLHVALFPWPALGHLRPFTETAIWIAEQGHRVSVLATPKNILRLPEIPASLSGRIRLVELEFPSVDGLPPDVQATTDFTAETQRSLLRKAYDKLQPQVEAFLQRDEAGSPKVDWLISDFAAHWAPAASARFAIPCAFLHLTNAAVLGYMGPSEGDNRRSAEDLSSLPPWVPFPTTVYFRAWEINKIFSAAGPPDPTDVPDFLRYKMILQGSHAIVIRSSKALEPEWFKLLEDLHKKPVLPLGMLPPVRRDPAAAAGPEEKGRDVMAFLDGQAKGAVLYASFGTEATLAPEEIRAIAEGLDLCGLPFVLVLRSPTDGSDALAALPAGFVERVKERGTVCVGWVPQVQILRHPSVGGFLTHGGWSSVVEGLALGLKMVVLPMVYDQGCNARLLEDKGISLEVPRDDAGIFTPEDVARTVRRVMLDPAGEFGAKVKECSVYFGDETINKKCVTDLLGFLAENKGMLLPHKASACSPDGGR